MEVLIDDHMLILGNDVHAYVTNTGIESDTGEIQLAFMSNGMSQKIDVSIDDAIRFRDMLTEGIENAFEVCEDIKCPACGYGWEESKAAGDHRNCRRYPFFPDERGKSYAK